MSGSTWGMATGRGAYWRHRAVCRGEDPELSFPIGTTGPALDQVEQAKAVCGRCSVSDECLKWALETGQDAGVWGGRSEEERRLLRRRYAELVVERFGPVGELAAEARCQTVRRCEKCLERFKPRIRRQRLCQACGIKHSDRAVRRRYAEAVAAR